MFSFCSYLFPLDTSHTILLAFSVISRLESHGFLVSFHVKGLRLPSLLSYLVFTCIFCLPPGKKCFCIKWTQVVVFLVCVSSMFSVKGRGCSWPFWLSAHWHVTLQEAVCNDYQISLCTSYFMSLVILPHLLFYLIRISDRM